MQNIQRVRKLLDIDALRFPDPLLVGSKIAKLAAGVAHVRYGTLQTPELSPYYLQHGPGIREPAYHEFPMPIIATVVLAP